MENQKIIMIDMDGVMADVYDRFVEYEQTRTGRAIDREAILGITESKAFTTFRECLSQDGFFETAPVMAGAVETVKYLNSKYRVLIVSAATEYPKSMIEKFRWLEKNFPYLSWKQFVFCGVKDFVRADVVIDDHLRHLKPFALATKILFAQPHNLHDALDGIVRTDWKGIGEIL